MNLEGFGKDNPFIHLVKGSLFRTVFLRNPSKWRDSESPEREANQNVTLFGAQTALTETAGRGFFGGSCSKNPEIIIKP